MMAAESMADDKICRLLEMPKVVRDAPRKAKRKGKHLEFDYLLDSEDGQAHFTLFTRQNTILADDFTCGLRWDAPSGEGMILARYNGSSHPHRNKIEGDHFVGKFHIHTATERYVVAGFDAEGWATPTDRYRTLRDALKALAQDFRISGVQFKVEQLGLGLE